MQINGLKEYLQFVASVATDRHPAGFTSKCMEDFVLKHGKPFRPVVLDIRVGRMGECFANASRFIQRDPKRYVYVEGYAYNRIPMQHAWCYDRKTKKAIDPTWQDETNFEEIEYFGVPFRASFLNRVLSKRGYFGVLDDYQNRWPLLRVKTTSWRALV